MPSFINITQNLKLLLLQLWHLLLFSIPPPVTFDCKEFHSFLCIFVSHSFFLVFWLAISANWIYFVKTNHESLTQGGTLTFNLLVLLFTTNCCVNLFKAVGVSYLSMTAKVSGLSLGFAVLKQEHRSHCIVLCCVLSAYT